VILDDSARTRADEAARVRCVVDWFGWVKISRMGSAIAATPDRRAGCLIGCVGNVTRRKSPAIDRVPAQHPQPRFLGLERAEKAIDNRRALDRDPRAANSTSR